MSQPLDSRELRRAFGQFATGVAVVTGVNEASEPVGLTVNSLTSVSLDPPMLLWCLSDRSGNASAFRAGAGFNVSVLADTQGDLATHFARSARTKFDIDPAWKRAPEPPLIEGALVTFHCKVDAVHTAGDHLVIMGLIDAITTRQGEPLVFHGGAFGSFQRNPSIPRVLPDGRDDWL
jgi:hypothetical protein